MRRGGAGAVQIIPTPGGAAPVGLLTSYLAASNSASQTFTTTPSQQVAFSITIGTPAGISRSSSDFTILTTGYYLVSINFLVQQLVASNEIRFFTKVNGVVVTSYTISIVTATVNEVHPVVLTFRSRYAAGDVLTFWGVTSIASGASIVARAALGDSPATRTTLNMLGWSSA